MGKKLLIVEDDNYAYASMERTIQDNQAWQKMDIEILRVATYADAKRALRDWNPLVVATDMMYPLTEGGRIEPNAGAHLIGYVNRRYQMPCILYSSSDIEESKEKLLENGVDSPVTVFKKDLTYGHTEWVTGVMAALTNTTL